MHKDPMKFEQPNRVAELDIVNTLKKAGITESSVVCDYGAGTGVVSVEAAKHTNQTVFALDMDKKMLDIIDGKVSKEGLTNIKTMLVEPDCLPLEAGSVDLFMLTTVLHEILDVPSFIANVKKVLKEKGIVAITDFYKKETPMGPPVSHRMSAYQAARHFFREDIQFVEQYDLGENLYLLILQK